MKKRVNKRRCLYERLFRLTHRPYTVTQVIQPCQISYKLVWIKLEWMHTDEILKSCRMINSCRSCSSGGAPEIVVEFIVSGKRFLWLQMPLIYTFLCNWARKPSNIMTVGGDGLIHHVLEWIQTRSKSKSVSSIRILQISTNKVLPLKVLEVFLS